MKTAYELAMVTLYRLMVRLHPPAGGPRTDASIVFVPAAGEPGR